MPGARPRRRQVEPAWKTRPAQLMVRRHIPAGGDRCCQFANSCRPYPVFFTKPSLRTKRTI